MERTRALPVGIVVRRTPGATRWAPWSWRAVAALPGAGPAEWREMRRETVEGREAVEFHAATGLLELHRADCEAYAESLDSAAPSIWAIFHPTGDRERPWDLHAVTASPFEAQDALDSGEELVERIPLTPELAGWIAEFVEAHWRPEPFRKRRRSPATMDGVESGRGDPRIRQEADVYRAPGALKPERDA
jgi:hypothetical protein